MATTSVDYMDLFSVPGAHEDIRSAVAGDLAEVPDDELAGQFEQAYRLMQAVVQGADSLRVNTATYTVLNDAMHRAEAAWRRAEEASSKS
jgi:hypothetical protein